jgi:hypothetical protein
LRDSPDNDEVGELSRHLCVKLIACRKDLRSHHTGISNTLVCPVTRWLIIDFQLGFCYDAEVVACTTDTPEQVLVLFVGDGDGAAITKNEASFEQLISEETMLTLQ